MAHRFYTWIHFTVTRDATT